MSEVYIRLVIDKNDEDSGRKMGLFMAMQELRESNGLYDYEEELVKELHHWFDLYLEAPPIQASESNYYSTPMAISWFKSSATKHISKMREFGQILDTHGIYVTELRTERPGKILYEDDYQIAATPFQDTFK
jgi:hypothetical protein